ncbi:hypothetical protein, partial [Acidaminococcus fermentans]|uniref:hypothetical protein n=1 Tax=Acidaminococcus fermentans TaxID=905 RepID=UPI003F89379A
MDMPPKPFPAGWCRESKNELVVCTGITIGGLCQIPVNGLSNLCQILRVLLKQPPGHGSRPATKKRSCEEMRIHFFTAPFLLSLFTPGSKKQEKKG